MTKINVQAVRKVLQEHPEGLSITQMAEITGIDVRALNCAVKATPEAYVDRWAPNRAGTDWVVVYCLMEKPAMPPKPTIRAALYIAGLSA